MSSTEIPPSLLQLQKSYKDMKIPIWTIKNHNCWGLITKVYDGDTVHIVLEVYDPITGQLVPKRFTCRVYGYDSPELITAAGNDARNFLANLILGKLLFIECMGADKYGRLLGKLYIDNQLISEIMIKNNFGKPYFGGKKE